MMESGDGEELGGVEGWETVFRLHCMRKNLSLINTKNNLK